MAPIAAHALNAKLMGAIGKFRESDRDGQDHDPPSLNKNVFDLNQAQVIDSLTREFERTKEIDEPGLLRSIWNRFRAPNTYNLLNKFQIQLDKELDLSKIIHRLRLLIFTAMGTLTSDQSVFVDKMSGVILRESTDFDKTSSDEELDGAQDRDDFIYSTKRMIRSSN